MNRIKSNRLSEVIYQIYPASFKDANGDGQGDLKGITEELDYIKSLHVDAIWISPFFKSPVGTKGDGGYAISNYREIDPRFGTMQDFEMLLEEAHKRGLRIYTDFVMCHTADDHEWFENSRNRQPEFEDRYVWSPGKKDPQGNLILVDGKPILPNNWKSVFGGPAWTFDEKRGEFFLHHFGVSQPALNANRIDVQDAVLGEMKFWLDKGVDGLRLDALPYANYDPQLRDNPLMWDGDAWQAQYFEHSLCQPETVEYVKRIRKLFDSYQAKGLGKKTTLGEAIAGKYGGFRSMEVATTYVDAAEGLDTCYTELQFWKYPSAGDLKSKLNDSLKYFPDGSMCNVLSNHDFSRASTRMMPDYCPQDLQTTVQRQLMAINFSLPGSVCVLQGEELGLPDARIPEDIPYDKRQDLLDARCRDIARAPIPWRHDLVNAGFSSSSTPYLPMPEGYVARAVDKQTAERNSMLSFMRHLIADRSTNPAMKIGTTTILDTPEPIFAFTRQTDEQSILFVFNMGPHTISINPVNYLDAETLEKLHLTKDSQIIVGPYDFSRRGLVKAIEATVHSSAREVVKRSAGINILAVDFLVAGVFNHGEEAVAIAQRNGWQPGDRVSIDKEIHEQLLRAVEGNPKAAVAGSTLPTIYTLSKLQADTDLHVEYLGIVGGDRYGSLIKDVCDDARIKLLTSHWPDDMPQETTVSHIIKMKPHPIVATYAGTEAQGLLQTLHDNPKLLETSIARADIIYLPCALTEKFGQTFTDEILRLRWKYKRELVLALPIHAKFGPHDAETFRNLVKSANIVTGNDTEYCRIYGLDATRPTSDINMKIVTDNIREAFREQVLQNNDMPCSSEPIALITRGSRSTTLVVTEGGVCEVPINKIETVRSLIGAGAVATASFLDGMLRGLHYEQATRFAMAMAAEKVGQKEESSLLSNAKAARDVVLKRASMKDVADVYVLASDKDSDIVAFHPAYARGTSSSVYQNVAVL